MGYDMYMVETPPLKEDNMHEALRLENEVLPEIKERSEAARIEAKEKYGDAWADYPKEVQDQINGLQMEAMSASFKMSALRDPGYYRLNIWGMGECREAMDKLNMLVTRYTMDDKPAWPTCPEDMNEDDWYESSEYEDQSDIVRAWNPYTPMTGIAVHKLGSNDGWIVTEEECIAAVKAYENTSDEDKEAANLPEWFDEWVDFLRESSVQGGFKVW